MKKSAADYGSVPKKILSCDFGNLIQRPPMPLRKIGAALNRPRSSRTRRILKIKFNLTENITTQNRPNYTSNTEHDENTKEEKNT
jgi:hypothetical protein